MTVRIVTDSTCDLVDSIVKRMGITVVPLYINVGPLSYRDGIDLSRETFYAQLPNYRPFPSTSIPSIEAFVEAYERLARQGATEIISVHIAKSLSAVADVARLAAQRMTSIPVRVIDSGQLTLGVGLAVLRGAELALEGHSACEVAAEIVEMASRTYTVAALSTVEFLKRSGRLTQFQSSLAALLRIYPMLMMNKGISNLLKVRTQKRAMERITELANSWAPLERIAVVHTNALDRARTLYDTVRHLVPHPDKVIYGHVTPVIGAHIGPGAVGLVCVQRR